MSHSPGGSVKRLGSEPRAPPLVFIIGAYKETAAERYCTVIYLGWLFFVFFYEKRRKHEGCLLSQPVIKVCSDIHGPQRMDPPECQQ